LTEIGRYRVEREIGRGGMAVVYLARQLDLDRPVALKELAGLHATDATVAGRFIREARLAGSLNHPNIVTVYDYFEHGGVPYIAMEYLPRGALRALVGALTVPQIGGVLDGLLAGLAHAEAHHIVHRDLKPENVLRTDEGGVKIADFGIAKAYDELTAANLTPAGEFVGAPAYVSPEQVLGATATTASDLYSIGVIAFELVSGSAPFADSPSASALLLRKVNERVPSLRREPHVDRRLADWIDALLQPEPGKRPPNAQAARLSLEEISEASLGVRWRRAAPLPAGTPERVIPPFRAAAPHRFASLRTIRGLAPTRTLVGNALTRFVNVAVAAGVAVAAVFLGWWLFVVALGTYLALAAITLFDEAEAARAGSRLQTASRTTEPPAERGLPDGP
jgi:serine/threonine protein kinase